MSKMTLLNHLPATKFGGTLFSNYRKHRNTHNQRSSVAVFFSTELKVFKNPVLPTSKIPRVLPYRTTCFPLSPRPPDRLPGQFVKRPPLSVKLDGSSGTLPPQKGIEPSPGCGTHTDALAVLWDAHVNRPWILH